MEISPCSLKRGTFIPLSSAERMVERKPGTPNRDSKQELIRQPSGFRDAEHEI
jgi:hypothetical protein